MKYILSIVASVATFIASAQQLPNIAIGAIKEGSNLNIVSTPTSTVVVDISVTTSSFTAGIYARYAQKYLGERAPLTNRNMITINGATLTLANDDTIFATANNSLEPTSVVNIPAQGLSIDRMSADVMIPEQAAQDAANQIFANRRICRDLIAGDIGEGVFGSGLNSALERFDRMEREYLALFMGQEEVTTTIRRFPILLDSKSTRYMVGRYDQQKGLLSANEIDGEPVYLQITPSEAPDSTYVTPGQKGSAKRVYIVPNMAQCDLYVGANIITSTKLPLYTYGSRATLLYDPK